MNQKKSKDLQNREERFNRFFERQRKAMEKDVSLCQSCSKKKICTAKNAGKNGIVLACPDYSRTG